MARTSNRNDEGASVVIGIILIVVITVVLSAVVAEFAFQLNTDITPQHIVGVKVTRVNSDVIRVTTMGDVMGLLTSGGTGHSDATQTTYTCTDDISGSPVNPCKEDGSPATTYDASVIGSNMYFPVSPGGEITVVAHFTDGTTTFVYSGKIL
ncbi:MAG: type IV pilin [Methanocella sp.]